MIARLRQTVGEAFAFRDVLHLRDEVQRLAAGSAHQRGREIDPHDMPVAVEISFLHSVKPEFSGDQLRDVIQVLRQVFGMRDVLKRLPQQSRLAVAEDIGQRAVHAQPASIEPDDRHADAGKLERVAETFFATQQRCFGLFAVRHIRHESVPEHAAVTFTRRDRVRQQPAFRAVRIAHPILLQQWLQRHRRLPHHFTQTGQIIRVQNGQQRFDALFQILGCESVNLPDALARVRHRHAAIRSSARLENHARHLFAEFLELRSRILQRELRHLAIRDVLKCPEQLHRSARIHHHVALCARPDFPAFRGDQRQLQIPRRALGHTALHRRPHNRPRFRRVKINRLIERGHGRGLDVKNPAHLR